MIRLILAAVKQREVDERIELDDVQTLAVLEKMVKQRKDSITQYDAANRQDLADVERAEMKVIETYLPAKMGDEELDALITAAIAETGASSARDMGKVVTVGAGFWADAKWPFMLAAARQIVRHYGLRRGLGVIARGLRVESVIQPPKGDMHYLAHLAVLPELRGHGIGRAFIDQLVGMARDAGRSRVVLDVAASNPRAEALYRRAGFKVTGERKSQLANERGRVPDHRRMERIVD